MSLTPSIMLPLGTRAPYFCLPDTLGRQVCLDDFADARALLVIFMCNHCPYVKHVRLGLVDLARSLQERGVAVLGINSNDAATHPEDSPYQMALEVNKMGYTFPYLRDETQQVAKDYSAACTPDFFLFDRSRALVYRGQMDNSRPGNGKPVTGDTLRLAAKAVLGGHRYPEPHVPSIGCNIKWRPGNEPAYYSV